MAAVNSQHKATLVFIRGIPGSGKSLLTKTIASKLSDDSVLVLDPDFVDKAAPEYLTLSRKLENEGLDKTIHPFRWLRGQAIQGAATTPTILWNQPFTDRGIFDRLVTFITDSVTEEGVELRVVLVELETPEDIAYERVVSRIASGGHGPSNDTFTDLVQRYKSYAEGYETVSLDGTRPVEELAEYVIQEIG